MSGRFDPIAALEAAYAPTATEAAWVQGVLEALAPLDRGRGLYGMTLDASDPLDIRVAPVAAFRPDDEWFRLGTHANRVSSPEHLKALYWRAPPVELASRRMRPLGTLPEHEAVFQATADVLGVFAVDSDDRGLFIGIPLPHGRSPGPRTLHLLRRVAAHLVSARRLRELTDPARLIDAPGDALLAPSGAVCHATGVARDAASRELLGAAVRRMERARSRARRADPEEAVELWRALVSGQWSLVDHVESDGRRFLLARRNEPRARDPRALSGLERQVAAYAIRGHANKHIAYLLGIAPSTVSSHLASACRKLGVTSRHELVRAFGGQGDE